MSLPHVLHLQPSFLSAQQFGSLCGLRCACQFSNEPLYLAKETHACVVLDRQEKAITLCNHAHAALWMDMKLLSYQVISIEREPSRTKAVPVLGFLSSGRRRRRYPRAIVSARETRKIYGKKHRCCSSRMPPCTVTERSLPRTRRCSGSWVHHGCASHLETLQFS